MDLGIRRHLWARAATHAHTSAKHWGHTLRMFRLPVSKHVNKMAEKKKKKTAKGVSENVVYPIVPNGFADHYPY